MIILLVDDNRDNIFLLESFFKPQGYTIYSATNGKEGLKLLEASPDQFTLIISDILMPVMDGFQFCIHCKQSAHLKNIPFVFYTATYTDKKDEEFAYSIGADVFLKKPLDPDQFFAAIKPFLAASNNTSETEQKQQDFAQNVPSGHTSLDKPQGSQELPDKRVIPERQDMPDTQDILDLNGEKTYKLYSERLVHKLEHKMEELEKSEANYRSLLDDVLDTSRVGLMVLDKDLTIAWVNSMICSILHVSRETLVGMKQTDFINTLFKPMIQYPESFASFILNSYSRGSYLSSMECTLSLYKSSEEGKNQSRNLNTQGNLHNNLQNDLRNNLREKIVEYWSQPVNSGVYAGGRIEHFLDITERKKLEQRLQQVQKLETVGTLAGGIAHDFNNILTGILGYADPTLNRHCDEKELQANLEEIRNSGRRAKDLINRILTFSRQGEQKKELIKPAELIEEALKLIKSSLPPNIDIQTDISSSKEFLGDSGQIIQIIMNLCINAGHAMQEKGGTLTIGLSDMYLEDNFTSRHPGMKPGSFIRLCIQDTGCGIPKDKLSRIFDPFFTTKRKGEGSGMGLAVVHGIVKSMGGTVSVYSEEGRGTEFIIYFPAGSSAVRSSDEMSADSGEISGSTSGQVSESISGEAGSSSSSVQNSPSELPGGSELILLVDNEAEITSVYSSWLEDLGYRTAVFSNGKEALRRFSAAPDTWDLLITDLHMPEIQGDELARRFHKIRPLMPVIICSGFSYSGLTAADEHAEFQTFVYKPVIKRDLAITVRRMLDLTSS